MQNPMQDRNVKDIDKDALPEPSSEASVPPLDPIDDVMYQLRIQCRERKLWKE